MRRAMAAAEVGDDGYREDPTVNELEAVFAERVGKEAALFVPSGTMANQIALRVLAPPGSMVVAGRRHHVVAYERGAGARNAGVQFHPVDDEDGTLDLGQVAAALEGGRYSGPVPSLVWIENSHMAASGAPYPVGALGELAVVTGELPVHLDGARLFNAEVATGVPADRYAAVATTVMSCLSKGLCAPVGSLLAGPRAVLEEARLARRQLGGGLRQAGVLAAAGLVALRTMVDRLADDHERAARLAQAVAARWPECGLDPSAVRTNLVCFRPPSADALVDHLANHGILARSVAPGVVRLATHHDVDDRGVARAVSAIASAPV